MKQNVGFSVSPAALTTGLTHLTVKLSTFVEKPREAEVIQPYKRGSYVAPPVPSSSGVAMATISKRSETKLRY